MQSSNAGLCRPSARTVLILYLSLSGCTSWRPDTVTPQAVVQGQPRSLRVTYTDSSTITTIVVNNPQLKGDTIVGRGADKAAVRVPLVSVLRTETRHADAGTTLLVVLGVTAVLAAVAAIAFVISCNQSSCAEMQR